MEIMQKEETSLERMERELADARAIIENLLRYPQFPDPQGPYADQVVLLAVRPEVQLMAMDFLRACAATPAENADETVGEG